MTDLQYIVLKHSRRNMRLLLSLYVLMQERPGFVLLFERLLGTGIIHDLDVIVSVGEIA